MDNLDVLQARDFKKDDVDKFEKYQAEALVYRHMPLDAFGAILCYNDAARGRVQAMADGRGVEVKISADAKVVSVMLRYVQGNLLESDAEALVNTVNTVGVMGKGVALMFMEAFPANFKAYEKACKANEVNVGKMFVTRTDRFVGPKWIINFPRQNSIGGIHLGYSGLMLA